MHWRRQMLGTCPGATWYPVLEGECDMRVPQVSERIKEAPAQALRGVFAGIGQLLLITDKLRNKASHQAVPRARAPGAAETVTDPIATSPPGRTAGKGARGEGGGGGAPKPPKGAGSGNFDKAGNGGLPGDEGDGPAFGPGGPGPAAAEPLAATEPVVAPAEPVVALTEPAA